MILSSLPVLSKKQKLLCSSSYVLIWFLSNPLFESPPNPLISAGSPMLSPRGFWDTFVFFFEVLTQNVVAPFSLVFPTLGPLLMHVKDEPARFAFFLTSPNRAMRLKHLYVRSRVNSSASAFQSHPLPPTLISFLLFSPTFFLRSSAISPPPLLPPSLFRTLKKGVFFFRHLCGMGSPFFFFSHPLPPFPLIYPAL